MILRITVFTLFIFSLFSEEHVNLTVPTFAKEEIIGINTGIRPYRKSGVRIEKEWMRDKLIIHNYGYGGSGLTLAFGGSAEVLKLIRSPNGTPKKVAVLGAGVVGLATAYDLLTAGYSVSIYADNWIPNLTSNVAGGIWTPLNYPADLDTAKKAFHYHLLKVSEERFLKSADSEPEFEGVKLMPYYRIKGNCKGQIPGERVTLHFSNGHCKEGYKVDRIAIDGKIFMEDLFAKVSEKGAAFHEVCFKSRQQIYELEEEIVINCLSIGSREIFNDPDFIPVKGTLIYFKPLDGFDYFLCEPRDSLISFYLVPWNDRIILGGSFEFANESLETDNQIVEQIISNALNSLKTGEGAE